jgi:hypothetical protein
VAQQRFEIGRSYPYTINQSMPQMGARANTNFFSTPSKFVIRRVKILEFQRLDKRQAANPQARRPYRDTSLCVLRSHSWGWRKLSRSSRRLREAAKMEDLVGAVGIEPTTFGLKGRCSTTELRP